MGIKILIIKERKGVLKKERGSKERKGVIWKESVLHCQGVEKEGGW